jgi:SAM-dependent methyltransferase
MLSDNRPQALRTSFDQVPEDYEAARPGYPPALIADIVALAALPPRATILEIGCGTGQATLPFALRGDELTCLDIGSALLRLARQKFAPYPNVQFLEADFALWQGPPRSFDLVMAATAFHWIPAAVAYPKAAELLKDTGSLALFANEYHSVTPGFVDDLYTLEQAVVPEWSDPRLPPGLDRRIAEAAAAVDATRLFAPVVVRTYPWSRTYRTEEYLRLLNTYSNYRSLGEARRSELFQGIAALLDTKYGGALTRAYVSVLFLAHR